MTLVDVHAHLNFEDFNKDREEVIARAKKVGLGAILDIGVTVNSSKKVLKLSKEYDIVRPVVGIYPGHVNQFSDKEKQDFFDWIKDHKSEIAAIGEVGLDFHTDEFVDMKEDQIKLFINFIELSNELNLPLIVHSRKAELEVIELLEKHAKHKRILMHSFTGKKKLALRIIENDWYISIVTNLPRNSQLQSLVKELPINKMITETDAPWLGPIAGERNEPKNVAITVKKIAELKDLAEKQVEDQIYNNYKQLFL